MPFPLRVLFDPAPQQIDLRRRQLVARIGRRHFFVRVVAGDAAKEFARLRLAAHNRAGLLAVADRSSFRIQPQVRLPLILVRPVTLKTVVRKNRPNVPVETHLFPRRFRGTNRAIIDDRGEQPECEASSNQKSRVCEHGSHYAIPSASFPHLLSPI